MARAAKTRGSIGAQGEVTRGRSKWSTEKCNMSYHKNGQLKRSNISASTEKSNIFG